MQQLDLFGNRIGTPQEEKLSPKKKGKPQVEEGSDYINEVIAIAENFAVEKVALPNDISNSSDDSISVDSRLDSRKTDASSNAFIFNDGKIGIKLKAKTGAPASASKSKIVTSLKPEQKRGRKSFKEMDAEVDLIEVPEDEELFQKQYYAISQVAEWFKVNTSLIRFWENEFDVLKPKKNRKGDRLFRPEDVKNLHLIYHLLRQRKYTIEGAKEYMKTNKDRIDLQFKLTNSLEKIKSFLLDIKANL